ncbi:MAG TPA: hypothetical protein VIL48_05185 [Acidimicrobiales bacterium]
MSETRRTADRRQASDLDEDPGGEALREGVESDAPGERPAAEPEAAADTGPQPDAEPHAVPGGADRWLVRSRALVPLYAALAAVLTWPLVAHLTDSLAYGTENNPTVQLFNLWTMRWNQDRLGQCFSGYWDAPIFHPTPGAFALSEPQPLTGLVFTPLSWLSGNPVLALNLVLLAIFTANGWAGARLARDLGAAPGAAVLAGALAEGLPFVAAQMGVLQLTAVFPLFLLLGAIVRWAAPDGGRRTAAAIGSWLAATFLTCGYYGLFAVVGVGVPALVLARRQWLARPRLIDAAVAGAVFAVLALPVLIGQARITSDYERPEDVVRDLSAGRADFWRLEGQANGAGVLPWVQESWAGNGLYPGTALLALGVGGAVVAYRRVERAAAQAAARSGPDGAGGDAGSDTADGDTVGGDTAGAGDSDGDGDHPAATARPGPADVPRRLTFLVAGAILARSLSLGLNLSLGPYRLVRAVVPGYESLRSPFRFEVLTQVFLVALAAYGLDALWRWRGRRRLRPGAGRPWGAVAAMVVVAAGVVEVGIMPVSLFRVDQSPADWAEWIAEQPAEARASGDGSFAYLPFPPTNSVVDYETTTRAMLQSLEAGVPTVNGYSGLFPSSYDELEVAMRAYPSEEADVLLREHGVSYLVVERDWLDGRVRPWLDERFRLAFEGRDAVVYEVV